MKPKSTKSQEVALRKRGRSALTEGQTNILLAELIDLMADGKGRRECFAAIQKYYKDTINRDLATSSYYEIYDRARDKWLTNVNLPSLDKYKKNRLIKSELLEEEIKLNSTKDITDVAKETINLWKYQDNLVGLNSETAQDSVVISINMDRQKSIKALEIDEEEDVK